MINNEIIFTMFTVAILAQALYVFKTNSARWQWNTPHQMNVSASMRSWRCGSKRTGKIWSGSVRRKSRTSISSRITTVCPRTPSWHRFSKTICTFRVQTIFRPFRSSKSTLRKIRNLRLRSEHRGARRGGLKRRIISWMRISSRHGSLSCRTRGIRRRVMLRTRKLWRIHERRRSWRISGSCGRDRATPRRDS